MDAALRGGTILSIVFIGVSDGDRTRDFQIHNLALYRLSYAHHKVVNF